MRLALALWIICLFSSVQQLSCNRGARQIVFEDDSTSFGCRTPSGQSGNCVTIDQCRQLRNSRNTALLQKSLCGFLGRTPKVCCPRSTTRGSTRPTTRGPTRIPPRVLPTTPTSTTARPTNRPLRRRGRNRGDGIFPANCGRTNSTFRRIIGGHEANVGAWPWMAVIYLIRRGIRSPECGGVLVTEKHIITAAHCVVNVRRGTPLNPRNIIIRLGDHDLNSDDDEAHPIEVTVRRVLRHESFNIRTFQNDIAVLELSFDVDFVRGIAPICLPFDAFEGDELTGRNAFVAGWGTMSFEGEASSTLQEVQLRIWDNNECAAVFQSIVPITSVNLCAGGGDKDSCRGDSGGPMMLADSDGNFYLIGVVSFGRRCAEPGVPGVYARVTEFLDWIESKIRQTS